MLKNLRTEDPGHGRLARWIKWRACDVGEAKEGLENELWRRWSSAHSPTFSSLHLRHNSFSNPSVALPNSQLILQPFRRFTYVTIHSPTLLSLLLCRKLFTDTLPSLYLRHSSFLNPSVASPTSQFILQPFFRFSYVTSSSLTPFHRFTYVIAHSPILPLLHLRHSSFSNPSFASLTSQDFDLCHLASRPWRT